MKTETYFYNTDMIRSLIEYHLNQNNIKTNICEKNFFGPDVVSFECTAVFGKFGFDGYKITIKKEY